MLLRAQIARFFLARFQAQPRNKELCQAVIDHVSAQPGSLRKQNPSPEFHVIAPTLNTELT